MEEGNTGQNTPKNSNDPTKPYQRPKSLLARVSRWTASMSPSFLRNMMSSTPSNSPAPTATSNDTSQAQVDGGSSDLHTLPSMLSSPSLTPYLGPRPPPHLAPMSAPAPQHLMHAGQSHSTPHPAVHSTMAQQAAPVTFAQHPYKPLVNGGDDHHPPEFNLSAMSREFGKDGLHAQGFMHSAPSTPGNESSTFLGDTPSRVGEQSFLWSSRTASPHPGSTSQPAFNVSAFCASAQPPDDTAALGRDYGQSPYYKGKTAFGGRAARAARHAAASPYRERQQVKAKPNSSLNVSGVTSTTARLILDTLERMSTPISDAHRIPTPAETARSAALTPSQFRQRRQGPPTQQLTSTSAPAPQPDPPALDVTQPSPAARPDTPSHTTQVEQPAGGARAAGKMRRDKASHHYSARGGTDDAPPDMPDLPTGFTLPITNMPPLDLPPVMPFSSMPFVTPKLDEAIAASQAAASATASSFGTSASSCSASTSSFGATMASSFSAFSAASSDVTSSSVTSPAFQFASPIPSTTLARQVKTPDGTFEFSSPLQAAAVSSAPVAVDTASHDSPTPDFTFNTQARPKKRSQSPTPPASSVFAAAPELKVGSVMDILGGKDAVVDKGVSPLFKGGGGVSAAPTLKQGSVMDILGGVTTPPERPPASSTLIPGPFGVVSGAPSWEGGVKSSAPDVTITTPDVTITSNVTQPSGFGELLKKSAANWECPTCMCSNGLDLDKCPACETSKPGDKPAPSVSAPSKLVGGLWECPTCMCHNLDKLTACPACEAPRPGLPPPVSSVTGSSVTGGFGDLTKASAGNWECPTCMCSNQPSHDKCPACETPKPGAKLPPPVFTAISTATSGGFGDLLKGSAGNWECPTCMCSNQPSHEKCPACETPRPGAKPTSAGSVFGSTPVSSVFGAPLSTAVSGFGAAGQRNAGEWECPTCMISNKSDAVACVACATAQPGAKPTAVVSRVGALTPPPSTPWTCDTCMVPNPGAAGRCSSCDAPRPGGHKPATGFTTRAVFKFSASSSAPGSSVFGNVKAPVASIAASTETPKGFAFTSAIATTAAPSVFGNVAAPKSDPPPPSVDVSVATVKPTFTFGAVAKSEPAAQFAAALAKDSPAAKVASSESVGSGFTFGKPSTDTEKSEKSEAPSSGGFSFGAPASKESGTIGSFASSNSSNKDSNRDAKSSPAPAFKFGSSTGKDSSEDSAPKASGFSFGTPAAKLDLKSSAIFGGRSDSPRPTSEVAPSTTDSKPSYTFGDKPATSTAIVFGQKSGAPAATSGATMFSFSAAKSTAETKSVFGSSVSSTAKPAAASFKFGADNPPTFGTATAAVAPTFTFGAKSDTEPKAPDAGKRSHDDAGEVPSAKKAAFMFGGSAAPAAGGFTFGSSSGQASTIRFPAANTNGGDPPAESNTPAFNFNQGVAPTFGSAPTPAGGSFNFSAAPTATFAAPATQPAPTFQFGVPATKAEAAPTFGATATAAGGGFNFSAPPAATPAFNFTAPTGAPAAPTFGSGAPPPSVFGSQPAFPFSAAGGAPEPSNPFNVSAAPQRAGTRPVKRAIRKLKK